MRLYHFIVGAVALGLASCAAYFSVVGIATFFGANFFQTAIAAGFLEAGKLVCASAAYRYRNTVSGWANGLLVFFTIVMMFVTSLGIFGFLSQSYQTASAERQISEQRIENVRSQEQSIQDRIQRLKSDRERLINTRNNLRDLQSEQGWLSERDSERLQEIPNNLNEIGSNIEQARNEALQLEQKITKLESEASQESKLGPIMFVADAVGLDPDRAALYFILTIIFVFDPMAVTLVVSLSMATEIDEAQIETDNDKDDDYVEVESERGDTGKSAGEVAEELGKPLPDEDSTKGWNYFEEMRDRLGHEPLVSSLYEDENSSNDDDKTVDARTPHLPVNHVSPPYEGEDKEESSPDVGQIEEDDEREEEEGFEEWLEGGEEEGSGPPVPDAKSAFKKPYRNIP